MVAALQAEGAPVRGPSIDHLEYLWSIDTDGYDLWVDDRGPLGGAFCGLPPYDTYEAGDFPINEKLNDRGIHLPSYIEPAEGTVEQLVGIFEKVLGHPSSIPGLLWTLQG